MRGDQCLVYPCCSYAAAKMSTEGVFEVVMWAVSVSARFDYPMQCAVSVLRCRAQFRICLVASPASR